MNQYVSTKTVKQPPVPKAVPSFLDWLADTGIGYIEQPRAEEFHQQLQAAIDRHNNAFRAAKV